MYVELPADRQGAFVQPSAREYNVPNQQNAYPVMLLEPGMMAYGTV
jgi:hypothetical protein